MVGRVQANLSHLRHNRRQKHRNNRSLNISNHSKGSLRSPMRVQLITNTQLIIRLLTNRIITFTIMRRSLLPTYDRAYDRFIRGGLSTAFTEQGTFITSRHSPRNLDPSSFSHSFYTKFNTSYHYHQAHHHDDGDRPSKTSPSHHGS